MWSKRNYFGLLLSALHFSWLSTLISSLMNICRLHSILLCIIFMTPAHNFVMLRLIKLAFTLWVVEICNTISAVASLVMIYLLVHSKSFFDISKYSDMLVLSQLVFFKVSTYPWLNQNSWLSE